MKRDILLGGFPYPRDNFWTFSVGHTKDSSFIPKAEDILSQDDLLRIQISYSKLDWTFKRLFLPEKGKNGQTEAAAMQEGEKYMQAFLHCVSKAFLYLKIVSIKLVRNTIQNYEGKAIYWPLDLKTNTGAKRCFPYKWCLSYRLTCEPDLSSFMPVYFPNTYCRSRPF